MQSFRWTRAVALFAFGAMAACTPTLRLSRYPTNEALFSAARREYDAKHWDNAVTAFEKLTFDLPARDTLLPTAHFFLAKAHSRRSEHLLAAQGYNRLAESFATDTLADDALFEAAREYKTLWRRPELDAQYGDLALATYQTLLGLYPDSELKPKAEQAIGDLLEWSARKDYETGMHYLRRKAYDSAIIYFKDVIRKFPTAPKARDAYLRLADAYKEIRYTEDRNDACATLRKNYPGDKEVLATCGPGGVVPVVTPDSTAPAVKPDSL